jgi:uncharacterized protein
MSVDAKRRALERTLERCSSLAVAYSGGVDSSFLLYVAHKILGERAVAVTARSPIQSERELAFSRQFAAEHGIKQVFIDSDEMQQAEFVANNPDRCYVCKRSVMQAIWSAARQRGLEAVAHGANVDDLGDYRPGLKAAAELGVLAPLVTAGLGKQEIRALSRKLGLSSWDRPSMACLASRIPYGTLITVSLLRKIDAAEGAILAMGFSTCRVRAHGDIARIELPWPEIAAAAAEPMRTELLSALNTIGFRYVTVDLAGYKMGSLNVF